MAAERQNTSASQEAPPPIIGIPSLLGRTWEHEPHLAREASSYDDLNILTEAHPRSSMWPPISLCTRHDSGAPTSPCIHDQDGNSSSTVSPATMPSGQWCLHAPVPSTTEVWVTKIKGNSIFFRAHGRSGKKNCPSSQYFLISDDECGFNIKIIQLFWELDLQSICILVIV